MPRIVMPAYFLPALSRDERDRPCHLRERHSFTYTIISDPSLSRRSMLSTPDQVKPPDGEPTKGERHRRDLGFARTGYRADSRFLCLSLHFWLSLRLRNFGEKPLTSSTTLIGNHGPRRRYPAARQAAACIWFIGIGWLALLLVNYS